MADISAEPGKRVKGRSPGYPAVTLETAIERLRLLYERDREHLTPAASVATLWGYKSLNGPASLTLASLIKFGLVEDEGSGAQRRLRVAKLGVKLLAHPKMDERQAAVREAALRPAIHRELWDAYRASPPSEDSLRWELTQERGFTETGAREFIHQYMSTIAFAGLTSDDTAGTPTVEWMEDEDEDAGMAPSETPIDAPRRQRPSVRSRHASDHGTTYAVPVAPGSDVLVEGPFPLSEGEWSQFIAVLSAMKPALVGGSSGSPPEPPEG